MRAAALVATGLAALCIGVSAAAPAATGDWPRFGGDAQLTNDVPSAEAPDFQTSRAGELQVRWRSGLDGAVIASPLFAAGVSVGGRVVNVVYAATQAGSVYAVDATDGTVLWQRALGTAMSTCTETQAGVTASYGIASTGVIDRERNVLYVIGATGLLYALDLGTGEIASGWPIAIVEDTSAEFVWGGLTRAANRLYVPVASYCDEPGLDGLHANGRLVEVDVDAARVAATFDVVPGSDDLGSIWGFGGSSVDPLTGDLWTATGNSDTFDAGCRCYRQDAGYAEAVVQLDPNLGVVAWSRPDSVPGTNEDADFGSTPLLFQPSGCPPMAAAYAKNGEIYVWRRDDLAGGQIWSFYGGPSGLDDAFIGEPSYSAELNMLIVSDARAYGPDGGITHLDAVSGFAVGPGCSLPSAPTWITPDVGRGPKAPSLVVGQLAFVVGGLVPGIFALDAGTGERLWSDELGGPVLAPPSFGDGQVFVADTGGGVFALGVGPAPPPPPPPPPPPAPKLIAGRVSHTTAVAGRPFTASMPVRSQGARVAGSLRCAARIAGLSLRPRTSRAADGSARCTWVLPASAHGKLLTGSMAESFQGARVSRAFAARVR